MNRPAAAALAAALALLLVLAGCGVPTGGQPAAIPESDVPYGLTEPSAPSATSAPPEVLPDTSRVYLIGPGDALVPRGRELNGSTRRERLAELLEALAEAPTAAERDEQLSTALPPEVELTVTSLQNGTATIDVSAFAASALAGRRAVAQIVLTATSVPGVSAVLLELAGEPIEAPLPGGELTDDPLAAEDYAGFRTPSPTPAAPAPAEDTAGETAGEPAAPPS
ncbi:GerMN domain-containing protein [Candidatus Blastococcus massiliensis]|uniref:GerMN domain-containing protein n=1 Tax=Candidatus Blastococcus massiliensis TaxID=1470358 RepID=UPI0004B075D7|nr:GerMN domain-containing protein [Candidatus Blastococcus massiliensis]